MRLTNEKKGLVVKMLLERGLWETGLEFGFDKHYKDSTAVKNAVYRLYQAAQKEPEKYFLTQEVVDTIAERMKLRTPAVMRGQQVSLREKMDAIEKQDFKELVLAGRQKSFALLMRKLDRAGRSNKNLDEVNLATLASTFGIIFDKSQIIQGEATENVAILAKVKSDMTPQEALQAVLQVREDYQSSKEKAKNKK